LPPRALFAEKCGICHALKAAGTTATTGPNLDEVLAGKDATYIEQQIVDPNSQIAQGFSAGIMPQDFQTTLSPKDLQGLVNYVLKSVASDNGGG
jgi:mono/diheme cytochrome c family protein